MHHGLLRRTIRNWLSLGTASAILAGTALSGFFVGPPQVAQAALVATGVPDSATVSHDQTLVWTEPGVLGNDLNLLGSSTARLVSGVSHGELDLRSDGGFTYTPDSGYVGTDTFRYRPSGPLSIAANVTITVTNAVPVAAPDAYTWPAGTTLEVAAPGVLANDTDADGDELIAELVGGGISGSMELGEDGSLRYRPGGGFPGTGTVNYRVWDGMAWSATTTITLTTTSPPPTPRPTPEPTPKPTPKPTPVPTPRPTPTVRPVPLPTPEPLPSLPLPSPSLPLPSPSLPLPTTGPSHTPEPEPTRPPTSSAPHPSPEPSASDDEDPAPSGGTALADGGSVPLPPASGASGGSGGSGASGPSGGTGGSGASGGSGESGGSGASEAGNGEAAPVAVNAPRIALDEPRLDLGSMEIDLLAGVEVWSVPAATLGVPGIVLLVWVALQAVGALAWIPAVRRLRGDEAPAQ